MDLGVVYLEHCLADPDFYDSLQGWDDSATRFPLAGAQPPPGWAKYQERLWVSFAPEGVLPPDQGWKVHVSATPANAEHVLSVVAEHCLRSGLTFKFLRSRQALQLANSKYADRAASGKFCVLYPSADDLERTVTALAAALEGQPGPYILSDLRWQSGPVYLRYGAFRTRHCLDDSGEPVLALADPTGRLVPDNRTPVFRLPEWAPVPPFLADQIADRAEGEFPYHVRQSLHFSNAGGVYLAVDPRTGRQVVIKEARPMAGLDEEDADAVARLHHERATLLRLGGLGLVPRVLDSFTCWEHHFLVLEHIEGESLQRCVGERHPLAAPEPDAQEVAEYTGWAVQVVKQLGDALHVLHERGVVVGDLQPSNVIVRPDGRMALVDLELALPVDGGGRPALGAPGFSAPSGCTGVEVDEHALAVLALWLFDPSAPVLCARDPGKVELFLAELSRRFGVAESFLADIRRGLRHRPVHAVDPVRSVREALADPTPEDWPRLRDSIAAGILATATPQRDDRLFPGDVAQFRSGGLDLTHGAAGVLLSLHTAGVPVDPEHVEWLLRAVPRWERPGTGFFNGLHGIAYVLYGLGHREDALSVLDRATATPPAPTHGLNSGAAGAGLNLLHFATVTGDSAILAEAMGIADRLAEWVRSGNAAPDRPSAAGLLHGVSGVALFFLHCHRATADDTFLDLAATALRADLAHCVAGPRDTVNVLEGHRLLPYIGVGTAGIDLVLRQFLDLRRDDDLAVVHERARRTCRAESAIFPGLFTGHAGQLACAALTSQGPPLADPAVRSHLRALSRHAQSYRDHLAFPGEQLFRLSTDLSTGAAGVLLALRVVFEDRSDLLPFIDPGREVNNHDRSAGAPEPGDAPGGGS
ncbi:tRNA A-37 threonylcarbamoyl transferase component Bud32 [Saccharothrix tamanrassetensis]|uniref:non-specific serine/threonine protein kinase n=1 Tax=Saccharothrix tamanrassetensis TaxID=1051531 RepID=A0A841CTG2_9PSEU|nr:class III lanthionine synthetase LanKC [Saccharothrix tamanrassetensis]MBB5959604.1 tRNA A-37 threonylcarbamoyl transferase component Bud32 [Saccharothrix tamanrassetensis]